MKNLRNLIAMHKKYYFLFLFLIIFISPILSQNIDYQELEIDREAKQIYVFYTIKESPKIHNLYGIQLYYSQDKGKNYIGPLQKVSGAVGKDVTPGEKLIIWDYHDEDSTFNGQDVIFKLSVSYRPDPNFLGGPENALYSLAVPGWGDTKVWQKPKFWYLNTIATYGLIGTGVYYRIKSNQTKNEYLNSNSTEEAQDLFDKSNKQKITGSSLILAGAAVWLSDITRVFLKGLKNKKDVMKLREKERIEPTKETIGFRWIMDKYQDQITAGFVIEF